MIAGLFDAYPKASSTKMIAGLFDAYSLLEIETYKPSSVVLSKQAVELTATWLVGNKLMLLSIFVKKVKEVNRTVRCFHEMKIWILLQKDWAI